MKAKIEKHIIKNRNMIAFAAALFFAGAVFHIASDTWLEGIIYFAAAVGFASLERTCTRKANEAENNGDAEDSEDSYNE